MNRACALLLLAACADPAGKPDVPTPEADTDTDTDADTDTDTDADTDTDTDADTDTTPEPHRNRGDLAATASAAVPDYARPSGALDLDGDGRDELLVEDWRSERLLVATVDARAGTLLVDEVPGVTDLDHAYAIGNRQVVVDTNGVSVLYTVDPGADTRWVASGVELPGAVTWAGAVGDMDGDGVTDAILHFGDGHYVLRGPVAPDLPPEDRLLTIVDFTEDHEACYRTEPFASGDVDGDGADDLVVAASVSGTLEIVYGPLAAGTTGTIASVAGTVVSLAGPYGTTCAVGVVDDLDGDGAREVVVGEWDALLVYDGLLRGTTEADPERVVEGTSPEHVAPGLARVLAFVNRAEASWWYDRPEPSRARPDATAPADTDDYPVYGRFGSADAVDLAWASSSWIYVAPGWEAPAGTDLDRDGWATPEDCDDADDALRPEAPEVPADGVDQDCDGALDEGSAAGLVVVLTLEGEAPHDRRGDDLLAWGPGTIAALAPTAPELVVTDVAAGATSSIELPAYNWSAVHAVGDLDGDGHDDVAAYTGDAGGILVYGPAAAPEAVESRSGLDGVNVAAGVGDLDGDGYGELVLAGGSYVDTSDYRRRTLLFAGAPTRDGTLDRRILAEADSDEPIGPVDLDGDGYADLLLSRGGVATFWLGPVAADFVPEAANASGTLLGLSGESLQAGDIDGDGAADLVSGHPSDARVDVALGPWGAGAWDLSAPDLTFAGAEDTRFGGATAWLAGEWLFVAATSADRDAGAVLGFRPTASASATMDDAALRVDGAMPGAYTGSSLLVTEADGAPVLVVGAQGEAAPLHDEGAVRVYALP